MLRLLTGDRWRIGPRDLALLGRRAQALAAGVAMETEDSLDGRLSEAVSGADPTEIVSLADAVEDPGDLPYSAEARARFADVSAVVRSVRRGLGASVADIVQLAIRRLDLDVETAVADTGASADLAALVDVADNVTGRSDVDSLTGFLSYLRAEEEFGTGLEVPDRARPGAVQVLTIHTAKGLEWDRVFVPFVVGGTFPSGQGREKWTSNPQGFPVSPAWRRRRASAARRLDQQGALGARRPVQAGCAERGGPSCLRRVHARPHRPARQRALVGSHPGQAPSGFGVPRGRGRGLRRAESTRHAVEPSAGGGREPRARRPARRLATSTGGPAAPRTSRRAGAGRPGGSVGGSRSDRRRR